MIKEEEKKWRRTKMTRKTVTTAKKTRIRMKMKGVNLKEEKVKG